MTWANSWRSFLGLSESFPAIAVAAISIAITFMLVVIPSSALAGFLERKFTADLQARVGPNRSGWAGILQPFADWLKLLQKSVVSFSSSGLSLWGWVRIMALYSSIALLPLGSLFLLVDTDLGAFLPFWIVIVVALSTLLMGLERDSIGGWLGGIRVAAQALSGAFPALLTILAAGGKAGGFKWSEFIETQGVEPWAWAALSDPFQGLSFLVFLLSGMVLLGVPPFDAGPASKELMGGVFSPFSGGELSLSRMSRFYGFFLWCACGAVMFLGGWNLPTFASEQFLRVAETVTMLIKTVSIIVFVSIVSAVTPRLRSDQVTELSWRVLSPFALLALMGSALWMHWRGAL